MAEAHLFTYARDAGNAIKLTKAEDIHSRIPVSLAINFNSEVVYCMYVVPIIIHAGSEQDDAQKVLAPSIL